MSLDVPRDIAPWKTTKASRFVDKQTRWPEQSCIFFFFCPSYSLQIMLHDDSGYYFQVVAIAEWPELGVRYVIFLP